jgi:ubiquinone/menaquinone biosynthesis C-methylase UbiE
MIKVDLENYIGNELALFEKAKNWKKYFGKHLSPYLKGDVLEVGAGLGGTTLVLCNEKQNTWACLEPDGNLATEIQTLINQNQLPKHCEVIKGTLQDLAIEKKYDAIIYIDVIEHIEDDKAEVKHATQFLKNGGVLAILVPAHQFLFNEFDANLGHFRRYNKSMLQNVVPSGLTEIKVFYLDSVGLIASLVNKWFLKQSTPTAKQIMFWDNVIINLSKITDVLSAHSMGKTVIGIWRK